MLVAVLGTGRVGGALGPRLSELGHQVIYGSRDPGAKGATELVDKTPGEATATGYADAVADADWVVLATPYHALDEVLADCGSLDGKIVIDITNALIPGEDGMMKMAVSGSAAEEIQAAKPGAFVVKAFNTVGFHVMANPAAAGGPVSVPMVGDDEAAKNAVAAVVAELGFEPVDVGPLRHAHSLEAMTVLYLVPYLRGQIDQAFEFYFRRGAAPKKSSGVRAAG